MKQPPDSSSTVHHLQTKRKTQPIGTPHNPYYLLDGQIRLFKRPKLSKNYIYETRIGGKYRQFSTGTDDLHEARDIARLQYYQKHEKQSKDEPLTGKSFKSVMTELLLWQEKRFFAGDVKNKSHLSDHRAKTRVLSRYFWDKEKRNINEINEDDLERYRMWRKNQPRKMGTTYTKDQPVLDKTVHGDFITLRQAFKLAKRKGWIVDIPEFPKLKIENRYRSWFSLEEYKKLLYSATKFIRESPDKRIRIMREDLRDYILMMSHTGCRVEEMLDVKVRDCTVKRGDGTHRNDYMLLKVDGKTGRREALGMWGAVRAYTRIVERHKKTPDDKLFNRNPRWQLAELLKQTPGINTPNLRYDQDGRRRDAVSFRHYFIMARLLHGKLDVFTLARICGTSVHIISKHYAQHLTARMKVKDILHFEKVDIEDELGVQEVPVDETGIEES